MRGGEFQNLTTAELLEMLANLPDADLNKIDAVKIRSELALRRIHAELAEPR
jgi:hypothetical protein